LPLDLNSCKSEDLFTPIKTEAELTTANNIEDRTPARQYCQQKPGKRFKNRSTYAIIHICI